MHLFIRDHSLWEDVSNMKSMNSFLTTEKTSVNNNSMHEYHNTKNVYNYKCLLKHILLQPSLVTNLIIIIHSTMQLLNIITKIARGKRVVIIKTKIKYMYRGVQK